MMPKTDEETEISQIEEGDKEHEDTNHSSDDDSNKGFDDSPNKAWKVLTVDGEMLAVVDPSNSKEQVSKPGGSGRKRSQIWKHFVKTNNGKSAKCHYCTQVLSFAGSLSNLLRHLRKKHPSIASNIQLSSRASTILYDSALDMDSLIVEVEGSNRERLSSDSMRLIKAEDVASKKMKATDIEYVLKRDHSYHEQPAPQPDALFAQFIQAEINKFQTEVLKRKCKREILQALMKYQQAEDDLYSAENGENGDKSHIDL